MAYCRKHKDEVDESYLYDEQLDKFVPDDENPTYVLVSEQGEIVAAASLIIDDYHRRGRNGRFRIFHSEIDGIDRYRTLLETIRRHTEGLDAVSVFVSLTQPGMMAIVEELGFGPKRYSFVMVRDDPDVPQYAFPDGYEVKAFVPGRDERAWCEVRNAGFAKLQGSETPLTPEMVQRIVAQDGYIEGGFMILYHGDRPVGVVGCFADEWEGAPAIEIGPLAIIPEYQGRGLGRNLLRASLRLARERSFGRTVLCVNAENDRATTLYIHEGFKQVQAVACYSLAVPTQPQLGR